MPVAFLAIFIHRPSLAAALASIQASNSACELNARVSIGGPIVHSKFMIKRPIAALLAAAALLVAAPTAFAQTPTPSPGGPPADASQEVKDIYSDYRSDVKIDVCDHQRADLQEALDTIEPEFDNDNPDFRASLEAGIQKWDKGKCDGSSTPTATATATPTATVTATPTADTGTLPPASGGSGTGGGDSGTLPPLDDGGTTPQDGTLPPDDGAATPAPVPSAVPTVAPAAPAATATPSPAPVAVATDSNSSLLLPGLLIAIAVVGAATLACFPRLARNHPSLDHAWREAAFRTRATWSEFTDWMRLGR